MLSSKLRQAAEGHLLFWCPGCEDSHMVRVAPASGPAWQWNGNAEQPTFTPSILVTSGHYTNGHKPGDSCWCTYNEEHPDDPSKFTCYRCHSFVTEGRIKFLDDCSHALAGQTVNIPDWPKP